MEGKIIGIGRTSEVYEYSNNCVCKLFIKEICLDAVEKEYNFSMLAHENSISTPKPIKIINRDKRIGIVYEKVEGKSLLKIFFENLFCIKNILPKMVELQYKINLVEMNCNTYTFKKYLEWAITECKHLTEKDKNWIKNKIRNLPDGNKFCHGDFHPENIVCTKDEYFVIDWMTGMQGTMAADVARTEMIMINAEIPENITFLMKFLTKIVRNAMAKYYVKEYCKISGMELHELNEWKLPLYVARLHEKNSKNEEERLIKVIKKEIKKQQTSA